MKFGTELVGYDARIIESKIPYYWNDKRKILYLVRKDVDSPLSVDSITWPSIFDYKPLAIGMDHKYREEMGLTGYPLKEWIGPNPPFWSSFDELQEYIIDKGCGDEYVIIAVYKHVLIDRGVSNHIQVDRPIEKVIHLLFKGYDIVAEGFISGLSNCGLRGKDKALQEQWGSKINKHHLFNEIVDAFEYKNFVDKAVREHSPFDIYSLWIGKILR